MTSVRAVILIVSILLAWIACLPIRRQSKFYGLLFFLLSLALPLELNGLLMNLKGGNNSFYYNLFGYIDFLVFVGLVSLVVGLRTKVIAFIALIGTLGYLYGITRSVNADDMIIEGFLVTHVCNSIMALYALYSLAMRSQERLLGIPAFWLFLGSLIYYGGSIPMLGISNMLYEVDRSLAFAFFWIVPVSAIIRYSFIGYSCILERRRMLR